ncbi:MAG: hypothetical protein ACLFSM_00540 [Thermoplasmata archaeon]
MDTESHSKLKKEYEKMLKELEEPDEDELEGARSLFRRAAGSWEDFDAEKFKDKILESRKKSSRNRVDL